MARITYSTAIIGLFNIEIELLAKQNITIFNYGESFPYVSGIKNGNKMNAMEMFQKAPSRLTLKYKEQNDRKRELTNAIRKF